LGAKSNIDRVAEGIAIRKPPRIDVGQAFLISEWHDVALVRSSVNQLK
jgi:hypothetical protein